MDPVSCWHLATSSNPYHRQRPPLPINRGNIALHAVSNPVWTSPQCCLMPFPWLIEEACGHVTDGHKIASTMLKKTPQLDSKMVRISCAGSQVVRAHATYAVDPGSNPMRGSTRQDSFWPAHAHTFSFHMLIFSLLRTHIFSFHTYTFSFHTHIFSFHTHTFSLHAHTFSFHTHTLSFHTHIFFHFQGKYVSIYI